MSTKTDIAPAKKVALLKHLAAGKSPEVVATIVGLSRAEVVDVASNHGYPDRDKLAWAADIIEKKIDEQAELPDRTAEIRREQRVAHPTVLTAPTAPAPVVSVEHSIIDRGKQHPSKRIQAAANKVLDDLDRLRTLLREDEEKHAERRKAEAAKAAARAEVERLEAQLAEAKAKLRGGKAPATTPASGPSAAEVRAWAAEQGMNCPAVGRVPANVREAYEAAHVRTAP